MGTLTKIESKESQDFPKFRRVPPSNKTVKFNATNSFQDYEEPGIDLHHNQHHTYSPTQNQGREHLINVSTSRERDVSIPSTSTGPTSPLPKSTLSKSMFSPTETVPLMMEGEGGNMSTHTPRQSEYGESTKMEEGLIKGNDGMGMGRTPTPTPTPISASDDQKYRVLLVDCDYGKNHTKGVYAKSMTQEMSSVSCSAMLMNTGQRGEYDVTTAINGYDALEKLKQKVYGRGVNDSDGYDAVVLDLYGREMEQYVVCFDIFPIHTLNAPSHHALSSCPPLITPSHNVL